MGKVRNLRRQAEDSLSTAGGWSLMRGLNSVRGGAVLAVVGLAVACVPPDTTLHPFPPPGATSVLTVEPPDAAAPLHQHGGRLVDADGRVVLLHGMNSVNKSAPYISLLTDGSLGPLDRAYLRHNGF